VSVAGASGVAAGAGVSVPAEPSPAGSQGAPVQAHGPAGGTSRDSSPTARPEPGHAELASVAVPFQVPLGRRFRGVEHREGLLFCGPSGWAEWAPFPEYDDWEAARWLAAAVEAGWGRWPQPVRDRVPVNVVVPALPHEDLAGYVTDAVARTGATTFKVKVAEPGSALADDLARVATVRAALSEAGVRDPLLRLDANGAWTVAEARRAARMFLAEFGPVLDYLEQPCRTTTELAELRYRLVDDEVAVRIAVDEGLRRARDLYADGLAASLRSAGDVLIVKVAPVGGVARALGLIEDIGLPVVVSGEMNTSVGLCAGIALAAAVPDLAGAAGLGTGLLLGDDVVAGTLIPRDGHLAVTRRLPDEGALRRAADALGAERALWWRERLARCARLLSVV
jgi:o-succinylbenzoate synthase